MNPFSIDYCFTDDMLDDQIDPDLTDTAIFVSDRVPLVHPIEIDRWLA